MKTLISGVCCCVIAIIALIQAPAAAAEEITCGKILGSSAPTATAPGSFVIPQLGIPAPAGTYISISQGTQFTYVWPPVWVCVRTTESPPTQVFGGYISTRTFVEFVQPGSPGYRAEPAPAPTPSGSRVTGQVGGLPGTSTVMHPPGPTSSTPLEKCGRVTAFDFSGTPQTNAGLLYIDGLKFVVGHPQDIRRSDIPPLTVPYASIRLDQAVCVRGLVDPLPGGWHLLSGEVVITGGLPNTSTVMHPSGQTEVRACGRLSAFSAPSASRPQGAIAINQAGTLVEYKVAGAGTVTPPNLTGLGTGLNPISVRFSGTMGSDGVVSSYSVTQVASCETVATLPGTATSGPDNRWLLLGSGVFAAALIALARRGTRPRARE